MKKGIPSRSEDYALWYNEIIKKAGLAENGPVRGTMIIKPYGFAIWEKMQKILDEMFKETGHQNAYFPLFVPKSFFSKEAQHVQGFAKECAIVTHYRLKHADDGSHLTVDKEAKLEEELIVRPTSETVIWDSFKKWIQSYRDLPILINQWANVVRWELRTRLFLRTSEFLWQEGHTAHATREEAEEEAVKMLNIYAEFVENYMAIPVTKGIKTESEKFAGAQDTYCIEAMMQDGKALQAGTSHFLGQNFAKSFQVTFANKMGKEEYVWGTSWGVSTRLMGALIMAHSDDNGLVLPPKLAPTQVVIIPIFKSQNELHELKPPIITLMNDLKKRGISVLLDEDSSRKPGWKYGEYELKGVPVRVTLGKRDLEKNTFEIARRDTLEKGIIPQENAAETLQKLLSQIQENIYRKSEKFKNNHTKKADTYSDFKNLIEKGNFVYAHWDGTATSEQKIKEDTKATIRCIPFETSEESGCCILTGNPSIRRVLFAKAY